VSKTQTQQVIDYLKSRGNKPTHYKVISENTGIIVHNVRRICGQGVRNNNFIRHDKGVFSINTLTHDFLNEDNQKRYFIFDTGVTHDDIDFEQYSWERSRYNKVREGDYFVYRRPTKVSENRKFYFFGMGQMGKIEGDGDRVIGKVINPVRFTNIIYQDDIIDYEWKWKEKTRDDFQYFFNIYGMNIIPFEDFEYFCRLGIEDFDEDNFYNQNKELVKSHISLLNVKKEQEDRWVLQKTRGYQQVVFSQNIKTVYDNKCCISGIKTKRLLEGCHISPWKDKENRTNIKNGLCLSVLLHRCFDNGLFSLNDEYRVILSNSIDDQVIFEYLKQFENKKIKLPVRRIHHPDKKFLKEHREEFGFDSPKLSRVNNLERLINSKNILHFNEKDSFTEGGIYMLYPNFDLKKITNETYLKVGITDEKDGLKGRLSDHYGQKKVNPLIVEGKVKKLQGGTTLHRHMYFDKTIGQKFGFDFSNPRSRSDFLKKHCYFKVVTSSELNLSIGEPHLSIKRRLELIEKEIQDTLRKQIRYIDKIPLHDY